MISPLRDARGNEIVVSKAGVVEAKYEEYRSRDIGEVKKDEEGLFFGYFPDGKLATGPKKRRKDAAVWLSDEFHDRLPERPCQWAFDHKKLPFEEAVVKARRRSNWNWSEVEICEHCLRKNVWEVLEWLDGDDVSHGIKGGIDRRCVEGWIDLKVYHLTRQECASDGLTLIENIPDWYGHDSEHKEFMENFFEVVYDTLAERDDVKPWMSIVDELPAIKMWAEGMIHEPSGLVKFPGGFVVVNGCRGNGFTVHALDHKSEGRRVDVALCRFLRDHGGILASDHCQHPPMILDEPEGGIEFSGPLGVETYTFEEKWLYSDIPWLIEKARNFYRRHGLAKKLGTFELLKALNMIPEDVKYEEKK